MSFNVNAKSVWELLEECKARGRIEQVIIYKGFSNEPMKKLDLYDAEDEFGEMVVVKHKRNRTSVKVWVI